jgi:hypothetical protein
VDNGTAAGYLGWDIEVNQILFNSLICFGAKIDLGEQLMLIINQLTIKIKNRTFAALKILPVPVLCSLAGDERMTWLRFTGIVSRLLCSFKSFIADDKRSD